jgi:glycosyltransferase involved in cell wall biosynthesis/predicted metal-dependent phosphoesterase TrpH
MSTTTRVDAPATRGDAREARATRVDMHCHSTASEVSRLGVQRALGLPECATPPREVYELAKRRGMDFVTITDHDTIDGVLEIADRPDVFVSEELTARFRGEPEIAVHVLCYGISPDDHAWLQAHSGDVELCAAYLYERELACALAHPYYTVGAPLRARHRRRLAELFGVWEVRNGARAPELNHPAATYVATRDGIGIGGSDDHAGVDIGRTFTEAPPAASPAEFLAHLRAGEVLARGKQGSAAKWAHAAIALAARTLGGGPSGPRGVVGKGAAGPGAVGEDVARPDPVRVMTMVRRLLREGDARHGAVGSDLSPQDARCLLRAWLAAVELDLDERGLIAYMQEDSFSHSALYRRACRLHERKLRAAVEAAVRAAGAGVEGDDDAGVEGGDDAGAAGAGVEGGDSAGAAGAGVEGGDGTGEPDGETAANGAPGGDVGAEVTAAAEGLFESCIAAIPYAPASAFLANEQVKLAALPFAHSRSLGSDGSLRSDGSDGASPPGAPGPRGWARADGPAVRGLDDGETPRVAILVDGISSTHGVTRTIEEIRQRGVPGFEIEVVGTDPEVDRRLSAVTEIDVPFYPGLSIGVPSLPAAVQTLAPATGGGYDSIHVCSPGPVGVAGALLARTLGLPLLGSYHTELTAYAGLRSGRRQIADAMALAVGAFYNACDLVLSPSRASDEALAAIGMGSEKVLRWDRGVDTSRFDPALRDERLLGGDSDRLLGQETLNVLYCGRITREKGVDLLAEAFLRARSRDPRLHLVLAGGGPEQERLRERLGETATFLGWLGGSELARVYASADLFLFPSALDTFGQVILEAQASGLPVIAVAEGGPLSLIENRVTGLLCEADASQLADALLELASSPLLRERLSRAALSSVRSRTWERALERLAEGYWRVLTPERDLGVGDADVAGSGAGAAGNRDLGAKDAGTTALPHAA